MGALSTNSGMSFQAAREYIEATGDLALRIAKSGKAQAEAGTNMQSILNLYADLGKVRARYNRIAAHPDLPGLLAYLREQYSDAARQFVQEAQAARDAVNSAVSWIENNIPTDGNGFVGTVSLNNGEVIARTLSPAQLSSLATVMDALIAEID